MDENDGASEGVAAKGGCVAGGAEALMNAVCEAEGVVLKTGVGDSCGGDGVNKDGFVG